MRLLSGVVLTLFLLAPRIANACSWFAMFGDSQPADLAGAYPTNGTVFVEATWFANWSMSATLGDPRTDELLPVGVEAHGNDLIQLHLPELDPGVQYRVHVSVAQAGAAEKTILLLPEDESDDSPPVAGAKLVLNQQPGSDFGTCYDPAGWLLRATFDPAIDDRGVAAYVLQEVREGNSIVSHTGILAPRDGSVPTLTAYVGKEQGERCFFVEAFDLAGNRSGIGTVTCIEIGDVYFGPPETTDIGDGDLELTDGVGCGCTAGARGSGSPLLLLLLFAPLSLLRRQSS